MRLLIITQKVDRRDAILGFFHRWIEEFATHCSAVTVIGQSVGEYQLSSSVRVESLGKEFHVSRLFQFLRFWWLLIKLHGQYDCVLVHMTPIWVVLGFPIWFLLRKPVYLWYEARGVRWSLRIALWYVRASFSASIYGMPIPTPKSKIVGHGIDTEFFSPGHGEIAREPHLLIAVGRVTRSKNLDVIIHAIANLPREFALVIAGGPRTPDDKELVRSLKEQILHRGLKSRVTMRPVSHEELVPLLRRASIMLHASTTSLDKVVLEAMACGCMVVSSAEAVQPLLAEMSHATNNTLADAVLRVSALASPKRDALVLQQRLRVVEHHSLPRLIACMVAEMSA